MGLADEILEGLKRTDLNEADKEKKAFYYRNNSFVRSASGKEIADLEKLARKESFKYNVRLEYWDYEGLVKKFGQGNADRMWNR